MKILRIISISLLSVFFFSMTAFADMGNVYFDQSYDYTFYKSQGGIVFGPVLIIDSDGDSVSQANGIRMMIPDGLFLLFDRSATQLTLTGSAVTQGKIAAAVTPVYSDSLREVYLPVLGTFTKGMDVSISGLMIRTYRQENGKRKIGLDLNGDHISDVDNFRTTLINSENRVDVISPYPVKNISVIKNDNGVKLTWVDSPDLDIERILITKKLTRAAAETQSSLEAYQGDQFAMDTNVKAGDSIIYELVARDFAGNLSDAVSFSYVAPAEVVAPIVVAPVENVVTETPVTRTLNRMKAAKTYKGGLSAAQLRSTLNSAFAAQIVMSYSANACNASKSNVLAQKCLQAAKKYGVIATSVS